MRVRSINARENPVGLLSWLCVGLKTPRGFETCGVRGSGKLAATTTSFTRSSSSDTTVRIPVHANLPRICSQIGTGVFRSVDGHPPVTRPLAGARASLRSSGITERKAECKLNCARKAEEEGSARGHGERCGG